MQSNQKILIIGAGGGREHALGWKLAQSERVSHVFFAPGNAGTSTIGTNLEIKPENTRELIDFAKKESINLTIVASDSVLALGTVDAFKNAGLYVWGPTKAAALLETSKVFAKNFMKRHGLPTARWKSFSTYADAIEYLDTQEFPLVIKADGLALGKGVLICQKLEEAQKALQSMFIDKVFGESGNEIVIEEFLSGTEISIHAFSDGLSFKTFPPSQDHKRIGENDTGLNTGGMGTIAPLPFIEPEMMERIEEEIIAPTLAAMTDEGMPFEGVLYPGLMITKDGPKIIEFNARFGDPETETYMRLLDTDLLEILEASVDKRLYDLEIKWKKEFACTVMLASGGYPEKYEKGKVITGIEEAEKIDNVVVFHAGTRLDENNNVVTSGGRVLGVSATGASLAEALKTAYQAVSKISFEGMQHRKDIGNKAL